MLFRRQCRWKVYYYKEKGSRGPALKETDDDRVQLGHLQQELVLVLACFPVSIVNLSISNTLTIKILVRVNLNMFVFKLPHIDRGRSLRFSWNCMYSYYWGVHTRDVSARRELAVAPANLHLWLQVKRSANMHVNHFFLTLYICSKWRFVLFQTKLNQASLPLKR